MIIARSPLRVTLGGGGTDLPSYYEKFGGFLIAAAIDKYVYITLHETFVADLIVKYSKLERVASAAQLEHPIIRESFAALAMDGRGLELTSMADIPSGTGLGSSGSFTTALLKALQDKKIAGAGLDVFDVEPLPRDHVFRKLDNVVLTPHLGYVAEQNYRKQYPDVVEDIRAWLDGKPVRVIK